MIHIYVDADACPVKEEIYKVARRLRLQVTLVANAFMRMPHEQWLHLQVVGSGSDAADKWIVDNVQAHDLVVTADILLADLCIRKEAFVLSPVGKPFTEENIGSAVAMRNLLSDLRGNGEIAGGPPPMVQRDRSRFLQQMDQMVQVAMRRKSAQ
ncbi:YaiI/YqxD family protein [Desulfobotulus sp. H1]|uniref:UPF0178 protein OOT00_03405 n=1 Tax=Desulfobotulus pelophilus TaxID=2823377 RepID=A0ABT3N6G3_9BACT|nr:YaiI/YqxD family protein [Desulfobotulus pelophilus]